MSVMRALVHTYKADMNCMDHSDTTPLHVLAQVPLYSLNVAQVPE